LNRDKPNIGVVTWPIHEAGLVPLQELAQILLQFCHELHVITGGAARDIPVGGDRGVQVHFVEQKPATNTFLRVTNHLLTQVKISRRLCSVARRVDVWIFFFGGSVLLLPMLTAKSLRRAVLLALPGSASEDIRAQVGNFMSNLAAGLARINYALCDGIVVYSESLVTQWHLQKYRAKVFVAHKHFLDFDRFMAQTPLDERDDVVGYVGRLSLEKGITRFMEAIPKVLDMRANTTFFVAGEGQAGPQIEEYAAHRKNELSFADWIPHDELPQHLNRLKLLVLPSFTEGLPNIMLEAIACGTPVLATPVGAVPDVIKDGETGFIMADNAPACIAENIVRALNHPSLEQIARDARALVEREFTFEKAVAAYREILGG